MMDKPESQVWWASCIPAYKHSDLDTCPLVARGAVAPSIQNMENYLAELFQTSVVLSNRSGPQ